MGKCNCEIHFIEIETSEESESKLRRVSKIAIGKNQKEKLVFYKHQKVI